MVTGEQREETDIQTSPSRAHPKGPNFLLLSFTSQRFHSLPQANDHAFNTWAFVRNLDNRECNGTSYTWKEISNQEKSLVLKSLIFKMKLILIHMNIIRIWRAPYTKGPGKLLAVCLPASFSSPSFAVFPLIHTPHLCI